MDSIVYLITACAIILFLIVGYIIYVIPFLLIYDESSKLSPTGAKKN